MMYREISLDFRSRKIIYQFYFLMAVVLGAGAAYLLLRIPGDLENSLFLGLSLERLVLVSSILVVIAGGGVLFAKSWRDLKWLVNFDRHVSLLSYESRWSRILFVCFTFVLLGSVFLLTVSQESFFTLAPPDGDPDISYSAYFTELNFVLAQPYLVRLQPLVLLVIALSTQTIIFLPLVLFGFVELHNRFKSQKIYHLSGVYGILLTLWGLLGWTQLKVEPDESDFGWNPLGAPILDTQFLLVILIGTVLLVLGVLFISKRWKMLPIVGLSGKGIKVDIALGLIIWVVAAGYWSSFPYQASQFVSAPRYPNFEYYPNSDALLWDTTARSLLVGEGYKTGSQVHARRPVFAVFLAVLYGVIGQDYETVTLVQSALFAIFPALVYFVTKILHNRLSAILAATFVLLREGNAIALADKITVTHSRLVMAEMPTAIGVAVFVLLMIMWLRKPEQRYILPMIMGGILGAFMLVRIEVGAYLPLFLLFTAFIQFRKPKLWLINTLLIFGGLILFLTPWIWRNWRLTGQIFLEVPDNRIGYFLNRFDSEEENLVPVAPDNLRDADVSGDNSIPLATAIPTLSPPGVQATNSEEKNFKSETLTEEKSSPTKTESVSSGYRRFADFFFRHFVHNQAQGILIFPDGYRILDSMVSYLGHHRLNRLWEACCKRENYVQRFEFWKWQDWEGKVPDQAVLPILSTLFLFSVGIIKISQNNGIRGFFPILVVYTSYAVNSVARISGGRFVLLVDWIWIVIYSVGLAQLIVWINAPWIGSRIPEFFAGDKLILSPDKFPLGSINNNRAGWRRYFTVGLVIFLFGVILPITEQMIKPIYTDQTKQAWLREILKSESLKESEPEFLAYLEHFIQSDNGNIFVGRALYPRYYQIGEGEPGDDYSFAPRNYQHINFYLVGPKNGGMQLALQGRPDIVFPNASDVLVFGCPAKGYFDVVAIFIETSDTFLYRSPFPDLATCPLPALE